MERSLPFSFELMLWLCPCVLTLNWAAGGGVLGEWTEERRDSHESILDLPVCSLWDCWEKRTADGMGEALLCEVDSCWLSVSPRLLELLWWEVWR